MAVTVHDIPQRDPEDRPWLRAAFWAVVVIALGAGAIFGAYKMGIYGNKRGEEKLVQSTARVEIEFVNKPAWLTPPRPKVGEQETPNPIDSVSVPDSLMNDVIAFARKLPDAAPAAGRVLTNYTRLQNPQDRGVLKELASYLQGDTKEGKGAALNLHNRAWIKSIRSIRRESDRQANTERIVIDAEYRAPLGFVVQGDAYMLAEKVTTAGGQKQAVRLPGVYNLAARRGMMGLPCVSGVDCPTPEPGQAFTSPDVIAGLELAEVLAQQPYIRQIASIDVSNFSGRREQDQMKPFIVLDTVFADPATPGEPTQVWWGRPVGEEKFFEVRSPAKLGYLSSLFLKYSRIDAREAWVDVRFDQPIVPMAKARSDAGGSGVVLAGAQ